MIKSFAFIFALISILLLLTSGYYFVGSWQFAKESKQTTGVIINFLHQPSQNNVRRAEILSYPVVRFNIASGKTIEFTSELGYSPSQYKLGESVNILYHTQKPQQAKIGNLLSIWLRFILIFTSGLFCGVLAIVRHQYDRSKLTQQ